MKPLLTKKEKAEFIKQRKLAEKFLEVGLPKPQTLTKKEIENKILMAAMRDIEALEREKKYKEKEEKRKAQIRLFVETMKQAGLVLELNDWEGTGALIKLSKEDGTVLIDETDCFIVTEEDYK